MPGRLISALATSLVASQAGAGSAHPDTKAGVAYERVGLNDGVSARSVRPVCRFSRLHSVSP